MEEALAYCQKGRAMFARYADPDDLGFAAFDAAQANLYLALEKVPEAFALTEQILKICALHEIRRGPLIITAKHCQAMQALSAKQYAQAEQIWREILSLQEREKQSALMARTLNYLGLSAELQNRPDQGLAFYERARTLQQGNPRAFPVLAQRRFAGS
jgi:hypothetical protein